MKEIKELVEYIVGKIIDKSTFTAAIVEDAEKIVVEVTVDKSNIGKIIGKQGRVISAIRTVVSAAAYGSGKKYDVSVEEKA
ncbi:MAG: KH domain-containing protein [Christensenellaceae bacterium]|jgi:predicted RNA-binding protein YlqC (UPF0109 family)|nr:KH domain-containing protein [Christensenellaceae bacterium]